MSPMWSAFESDAAWPSSFLPAGLTMSLAACDKPFEEIAPYAGQTHAIRHDRRRDRANVPAAGRRSNKREDSQP
jgi:hypothetical protein